MHIIDILKILNENREEILTVFALTGTLFLKKKLGQGKDKDIDEKQTEKYDKELECILYDILYKLNADKVYICEIHSDENTNEILRMELSISMMVTKPGVKNDQDEWQDYPLSFWSGYIYELIDKEDRFGIIYLHPEKWGTTKYKLESRSKEFEKELELQGLEAQSNILLFDCYNVGSLTHAICIDYHKVVDEDTIENTKKYSLELKNKIYNRRRRK